MPMFPANRPANVTVDPDIAFTGPDPIFFPAARAAAGLDPLRDGDTSARKGNFPTFYPAGGPSVDLLRDRDPAQLNNSTMGHGHGESGLNGPMVQGAADIEHVLSTATAGPHFPSSRPAVVTVDPQRDGLSGASALNASWGGEYSHSTVS